MTTTCMFPIKEAVVHQRKHGLSTEPFSVSAYGGTSKNRKDLKPIRPRRLGESRTYRVTPLMGKSPTP